MISCFNKSIYIRPHIVSFKFLFHIHSLTIEMWFQNLSKTGQIRKILDDIGVEYNPEVWRLIIDSSSPLPVWKAVLLHRMPSIPVGHSAHLKEDFSNIKFLLNTITYDQHDWYLCGDFKMLGFLLGLQVGYTKYCLKYILCLWDSRADAEHSKKKVCCGQSRKISFMGCYIYNSRW